MVEFVVPIQTAEHKVGNHAPGAGSQLKKSSQHILRIVRGCINLVFGGDYYIVQDLI